MSDFIKSDPFDWKFTSPEEVGFHTLISPDNGPCQESWIFRLNLKKGDSYNLSNKKLELNVALISGSALLCADDKEFKMEKMDSFYLPGNMNVAIEAIDDLIIYIGGGIYEGIGEFFFRKFDLSLALGNIHQVHGEPPYQREVFMTLNPEMPASRLIAGFTWGEQGQWTSWPPHQHENDLEETYFYFDIPTPKFAMHFSYTDKIEVAAVHRVSSGDLVIAPHGYHPTTAIPGVKSTYFWVLVARSHESRSYDLAFSDPLFK